MLEKVRASGTEMESDAGRGGGGDVEGGIVVREEGRS